MGLIYLITMAENFQALTEYLMNKGQLLLVVFKVTIPSSPCPSSKPMARDKGVRPMKINRQLSD